MNLLHFYVASPIILVERLNPFNPVELVDIHLPVAVAGDEPEVVVSDADSVGGIKPEVRGEEVVV